MDYSNFNEKPLYIRSKEVTPIEKWNPFERPLLPVDLFLTLYKTNHHLVQRLEERLAAFDLTLGRWCILVALRSSGRAMLPSELSVDLTVTRANISNLLNALEQSGWVLRQFDQTNRRRILVSLTDEGYRTVEEIWPVYEQVISQHIGGRLTEQEQEQLKLLLKKLF